jgi:signal transduction histidine kinase
VTHIDVSGRDSRIRGVPALAWLRRGLWLLTLAGAAGVFAMTVVDSGLEGVDTTRALAVLVGLSFAGSGLYAWGRRPESRLGPLMTVVGCIYLAWQVLVQAEEPLLFTSGVWLSDAWVFLFVAFLLSFPEGRLATAPDLAIVAMFATVALPLELAWLLVWHNPMNALAVWPNEAVAERIDWIQRGVIVTASVLLAVRLSRRWFTAASMPLRRSLAPVLVGAAAILFGSLLVMLDKFEVEYPPARWLVHLAFIAIPLAILAGMLRSRLARSTVGELFVALRADPSPANLRDVLSHALRDPSLVLAYWLPDFASYADHDGRSVQLPGHEGRHVVTPVDRDGSRVAVLLHDRALTDEPELLEAVTAAAGIAIENARLQAELKARLEELRGSRSRVIAAGESERKRLERNLHDGAQQRLIALSLELSLLEERLESDPDARTQLGQARQEIAASLGELREVARGLHPAVVTGHGLDVALEQLVARAPVPIRLTVVVGERLPEQLEVAAYYLVSESLANVGKHAQASSGSVEIRRGDGVLVVEVVDDGIGGADTETGSGLRGLADRVEALGGRLRVWSPVNGGTRVKAEIPCAP